MNPRFDRILSYHCAPVLMGEKEANLICSAKSELPGYANLIDEYRGLLAKKGLKIKLLWEKPSRILILIYNPVMLGEILEDPDHQDFLARYGYARTTEPEAALTILQHNIRKNGGFPHEIGIFLGYPLADVEGFIANGGRGAKACGYWKVYGEVEPSLVLFSRYDECRKIACDYNDRGYTLDGFLQAI